MNTQNAKFLALILAVSGLFFFLHGVTGLGHERSSESSVSPEQASELVQHELGEGAFSSEMQRSALPEFGEIETGNADAVAHSPVVDEAEEVSVLLQVESDVALPSGGRGVRIYGSDRYRIDQPEWVGVLDDSGSAEAFMPPGTWYATVDMAPSMLWEFIIEFGAESATVSCRISQTRSCNGRCVTFAGAPVPDAVLYATAFGDASRAFPVGVTDASGAFRILVGSDRSPVGIFADHPNLGASLSEVIDVMDPMEASCTLQFLDRQVTVRGTIQSETGQRVVVGSAISVHQTSGNLEALKPAEHRPAMSDRDGRFEIKGLHAGRARVEVRTEGFMPLSERLELRDGEDREIGLTLTPSRAVSIRLLKAGDHRPVQGGEVRVTVERDGMTTLEREARSDEDGLARIDAVPEGAIRISAHHSEYGYARSEVASWAELDRIVEIFLQEGKIISSLIRDERDWPVQLEAAQVELRDEAGLLYSSEQISTNIHGEFEVLHVSPKSSIEIYVYSEEFESYDHVFADTDELLVRLERRSWTSELRGRVVDGDGFPISGVLVSFGSAGGAQVPSVFSRDNGVFVVPQAPAGEFLLVLSDELHGTPTLGPFEAVEGENDLGDLALSVGARLSVRVSVPDGAGLPPGYCCLRNLDGLILESSLIEAGVSSFDGIVPNDYILSTHVSGFADIQRRFTLADGDDRSADVSLQEGVALRVRCEFPAGVIEAKPKVRVEISQEDGSIFRATILEGGRGNYSTSLALPRSRFKVKAWREGATQIYQTSLDLRKSSTVGDELRVTWLIP